MLRHTPRDRAIVQAAYDCQVLTSRLVAALIFGRPLDAEAPVSSRCFYRLQLLHQHRYLARHEQAHTRSEGSLPLIYTLDKRGAQWLAELQGMAVEGLDWHPYRHQVSPLFLQHLLAITEVRIRFVLAAKLHGFAIEQWLDDASLRQQPDYVTLTTDQGGQQRLAVIPDGAFTLVRGSRRGQLCLEVDRATVTGEATSGTRDWKRRVVGYLLWHASGLYYSRFGTRSFRVVVVTSSERRLAHLKVITEKAGGKSRFWLTAVQRLKGKDVLTDPIWNVAGREGLHSLVESGEEASADPS